MLKCFLAYLFFGLLEVIIWVKLIIYGFLEEFGNRKPKFFSFFFLHSFLLQDFRDQSMDSSKYYAIWET